MDAFDILLAEFVTLTAIAKAAGVKSYQNVQWWRDQVPAKHVLRLCQASEWRITPHILRPDLYPNPDDALPASMRAAA